MGLTGTATWRGRQGSKPATSCVLERRCEVRELHYVASPCQPDPPRPGSFAGSGGGRALSTHARQAGLSDQPWAVRACKQGAPARAPAASSCKHRSAASGRHGQRIRPRSPIGRRGNALCICFFATAVRGSGLVEGQFVLEGMMERLLGCST